MPEESRSEFTGRMADDGSGQVGSDAEIHANIRADFGTLAPIFTDVGDIPTDRKSVV